MRIDVDILGAGICAPGLPDWDGLLDALAGNGLNEDRKPPPSGLLSPRERRRAPAAVKLSFTAAEQACAMAELTPADPVAVFSSGMGDLQITDYMCRTLAEQPDLLSPTRFHNSVHNAASGYWSIGAGATGDVTAVSGWKDSAVAGLFEALSRIQYEPATILLVVYDDVACGPMRDLWPAEYPFGSALVLARPGHRSALARLQADIEYGRDAHPELPDALEARIRDNPAARILPLLGLISGRLPGPVRLGAEQGPGLNFRVREQ
jgi:hypothetical protein